jgi:hypothetical protein
MHGVEERERKEEAVWGGGGADGRAPPWGGGGGGVNRALRGGGGRGGALGRQEGPTAGRGGARRRLGHGWKLAQKGGREKEIPPFYSFPNFPILIYFQMHAFTNSLNEQNRCMDRHGATTKIFNSRVLLT